MRRSLLSLVLIFAAMAGARAQDRWIDEGKLGLVDHDIALGADHTEPGIDVNGELLFTSPGFLAAIGAPRPHLGGSVNTAGATSYAYFGLTWTAALSDTVFAGLGLGGAVHDGELAGTDPHRKQLGSRVLFHAYVELGYRLTATTSLSLFLDHMSNADLARHNQGMTNIGLRVGLKF